jgi:glycosyltransferase involved in cell wall biosynthesis
VKNFNLRNVHFISFKEKKELEEYYCASDIFVLPTREDIWGLVINEAMLYGLPIVTTNNCLAGKEMIIDFENGFVVPVEDVETLQCRINYLIDNDYLRNSIANKNILKIQNYTIENMTKVHVETLALENQNNTSNQ